MLFTFICNFNINFHLEQWSSLLFLHVEETSVISDVWDAAYFKSHSCFLGKILQSTDGIPILKV